jgi:RecA-family ATPase
MPHEPTWRALFAEAKRADMVEVARRVGAKLKRAGANWIGPCPAGCATRDGFIVTPGKGLFLCRPSGATGDAVDMVVHAQDCDKAAAIEFLTGKRPGPPPPEDPAKAARAKKLADEAAIKAILKRATPIEGTHAEAYLHARGVDPPERLTKDLYFVPDLAYWNDDGVLIATLPATVAAIRDVDGALIGIHRTYLDPMKPEKWVDPAEADLPEKDRRNSAKKVLGRAQGGLIRFGQVGDKLAVGEGIETTLAWRALGVGPEDVTIACGLSLDNIAGGCTGTVSHPTLKLNGKPARIPNGEPDPEKPGFVLPEDVRELILLGDGDSEPLATKAKVATAVRRHMKGGLTVSVHFAPDGNDWAKVEPDAEAPPIEGGEAFLERVRLSAPNGVDEEPPPLSGVGPEPWERGDPPSDTPPGAPPVGNDDLDRERRDIAQRIVSAAALAYDPEPTRDYLDDGVILVEEVTLVSGEGGIGKTRLMLQLGVAMQIDGEWLGMKVKQGPAIVVLSEEKRADANLALRVIVKAEGKSLAHNPDLYILPLADRDATMAMAASRFAPLKPTPLWIALEERIEQIKPRLVVLDSRADLFGGEENFRRHVRDFIVLLKRLAIKHKLAVVLVAHPSLTGINTGSGLSGSTDWHNAVRGRLFVEEPKANGNSTDKRKRTVTVKKAQHSDMDGTVFHVRWDKGVYVYERKDGGATPYDRAAAANKAETVFLKLLQTFEDQGRTVSPHRSNSYAPTVFANEAEADGVSKKALERAMSNLLKNNRIHIEDIGSPSRRTRKLSLGPKPTQTPAETIQ